jgi:hypothetical protein
MSKRLRYVVLHHEQIPKPHFDLMFETESGSALATWRCERWPIDAPEPLVKLPDHRNKYLTYEGLVSHGRGSVKRIAAGEFVFEQQRDDYWQMHLQNQTESLLFFVKQGQWTGQRIGGMNKTPMS